MRMSDLVAQHILAMLDEQNGNAEIKRNELANDLGCVPSQINYVITSRFTPEQGYIVESRRGGGGYIRITRVNMDKSSAVMHIVNSIGDTLDKATAEIMIKNMYNQSIIDLPTARLMASALSERVFKEIPQNIKDILRARIFKNMLLTIINN
ncbi:MAG: CtsR family transcriptional regulator [Ruminococcus sp.]|nr:CtsR family transcriptional regulator [Ruminococcus sp.]